MKRVAIVQSNYIPWKGYFDLINLVDEFILYDDMQYTRRDWRNRNYIKTPRGREWLTIPVEVKGKYLQKIRETRISDPQWAQKHWKTIVHNYGRARHFRTHAEVFESAYLGYRGEMLSEVNRRFIEVVCRLLGIGARLSWSMEYPLHEGKNERLIGLCKAVGADHYLSGPADREYLDEPLFEREGIAVSYMDYSGYPEYAQLHGPFEHGVSIVDLLFNEGPEARRFMKSFAK
jgi:hypothetical protein